MLSYHIVCIIIIQILYHVTLDSITFVYLPLPLSLSLHCYLSDFCLWHILLHYIMLYIRVYIYIYHCIYTVKTHQFARADADDVSEHQKTLCFVGQNAHVHDHGFHLATHSLATCALNVTTTSSSSSSSSASLPSSSSPSSSSSNPY